MSIAVAEGHNEKLIGDGTIRRAQLNGSFLITIDSLYDGKEQYVNENLLNSKAAETILPHLRIGPLVSFQNVGEARTPPSSDATDPAALAAAANLPKQLSASVQAASGGDLLHTGDATGSAQMPIRQKS